jgi:transcriptional regulator with XRE-family HTH domain
MNTARYTIEHVTARADRLPLNRDDMMVEVCRLVQLDHRSVNDIAAAANVSPPTVYKWLNGETMQPRLYTLRAVANVLGYNIALTKRGNTN